MSVMSDKDDTHVPYRSRASSSSSRYSGGDADADAAAGGVRRDTEDDAFDEDDGDDDDERSPLPIPSMFEPRLMAANCVKNTCHALFRCFRDACFFCMPFVHLAHMYFRDNVHPDIIWRLVPSVLAAKSVGMTALTLWICDLAEIAIVPLQPNVTNTLEGNVTKTTDALTSFNDETGDTGSVQEDGAEIMTFGLWSYSTSIGDDKLRGSDAVNDMLEESVEESVERVTTCQFGFDSLPSGHGEVFYSDPFFRTARALAVLAVCVGGLSAIALWLGAVRVRGTERVRRWRLSMGLASAACFALEGSTLLVLRTRVCMGIDAEDYNGDGVDGRMYRDCRISSGGSNVVGACVFWFLTGVSMVKFPEPAEDDLPTNSDRNRQRFDSEDANARAVRDMPALEDVGDAVDHVIVENLFASWFRRNVVWFQQRWSPVRTIDVDPREQIMELRGSSSVALD